jgi:predicted nucleic acid-binding protein
MYLIDTNVISEKRKGPRADLGVVAFWSRILVNEDFLPVQVLGELRRGVEMLKYRGDLPQAALLGSWLKTVQEEYADRILTFDVESAHLWGRITAASYQNLIDKQIAAMALLYDLTIVSRNIDHFAGTGARVLNPFQDSGTHGEVVRQ